MRLNKISLYGVFLNVTNGVVTGTVVTKCTTTCRLKWYCSVLEHKFFPDFIKATAITMGAATFIFIAANTSMGTEHYWIYKLVTGTIIKIHYITYNSRHYKLFKLVVETFL